MPSNNDRIISPQDSYAQGVAGLKRHFQIPDPLPRSAKTSEDATSPSAPATDIAHPHTGTDLKNAGGSNVAASQQVTFQAEPAISVAKVIEILSTSQQSFEDAIMRGVQRATSNLRGVQSAWVKGQSVLIEKGQINGYRVNLMITFGLSDREDMGTGG